MKSKPKRVCTRSSRFRIAYAVSIFALAVGAVPSLSAQASPAAPTAAQGEQGVQTLCQPQVIGNRRIPKESVLARLFLHQGDLYDPLGVERDFNSPWTTPSFPALLIEL